MSGDNARSGEVTAFLRGDPDRIASVEEAVRLAVRGFDFVDRDLERDLVQEALSRILLNLAGKRFRGEASLETYARTIARYTCLEHIRRRRRQAEVDVEGIPSNDLWSAPEESFLWAEEHLRNLEAFAALPAECRELLRLICVEKVSYQEAASRLGVSEAAIRSRIHRCRLCLRKAAAFVPPSTHRPERRRQP